MVSMWELHEEVGQLGQLSRLVEDFKESYNHVCWNTDDVKGRCDSVSTDLFNFLRQHGYQPQLIEGRGLIPELPSDAHPEWVEFLQGDQRNRRFLSHIVVLADRTVIDLTGLQFGSQFRKEVYPLQQFKRYWLKIMPFKP